MRKIFRCVPLVAVALTICVWGSARTPGRQSDYGPSKGVYCVAFTPDGKTIAAAGFDNPASLTITLWDVASGTSRRTLTGPKDTLFDGIAFSNDARMLATGSTLNTDASHYTVTLFDVATGKTLHAMPGHTKEIDGTVFSADGKTVASGSQDQSIKLWDVASGKLIRTMYDNVGMAGAVAFTPDGRTLASTSNNYAPMNDNNPADQINTIDLWDTTTGKNIRVLPHQSQWTSDVIFSPDGKTLASANWDNTITLWDATTWRAIGKMAGHTDIIAWMAFSPDGRTLASGSNDKTAKLWNTATGELLQTLAGHADAVTSVSFSPDGKTVATGSSDNTIKLWDAASGKILQTFGVPNPVAAAAPKPKPARH
jgi:WD40 repeat protein